MSAVATRASEETMAKGATPGWNVRELAERVEYEAWTLRHYLARAFNPGGGEMGPYEVAVTRLGEDLLHAHANMTMRIEMGMSDGAVMEALRRLAPLAFQAAFKVQDMVIEWVLRANGCDAWEFSKKVEEYKARRQASTLALPPFFASRSDIEGAHFALYRRLSQRRNVLIHDSSFELLPDGTLRIYDEAGRFVDLTLKMLRAYIEAVLVVVDLLEGRSGDSARDQDDLEAALNELRSIHNVATPSRRVRWVAITLRYEGAALTRDKDGLALTVDLKGVRQLAKERFPVNPGDQHRIRLVVESKDAGTLHRWTLEPADVRGGDSLVLRSADPRCSKSAA